MNSTVELLDPRPGRVPTAEQVRTAELGRVAVSERLAEEARRWSEPPKPAAPVEAARQAGEPRVRFDYD